MAGSEAVKLFDSDKSALDSVVLAVSPCVVVEAGGRAGRIARLVLGRNHGFDVALS